MSWNWVYPIILGIVFSGALLGMLIGRLLPPQSATSETKAGVSVSMAVVGTLSALVLGLLMSNAISTFNARNAEVARLSADIIQVNRLLHRYGPEADVARGTLRRYTAIRLDDLFPTGTGKKPKLDDPAAVNVLERLQDQILSLKLADGRHRWLSSQAMQIVADLSEMRWLLVAQEKTSIPVPALSLIVFWLTLLFTSFGLFAPRNITMTIALFLCSLVASSALAMVVELYTPFIGTVRLSDAPMRYAIEMISH